MSTIEKLFIIQQYIDWYGSPILLIFGSIGCLFNILLFSRRQFRTLSCSLYFLAASVAMLVLLNIGIVPTIYAFNHPNPFTTISSFCKARTYIAQISVMMYRWFIVAACIDRYIHTFANRSLLRFTHSRTAYRVILVNVIFWSIMSIHQLIWIDISKSMCTIMNVTVRVYNSFYAMICGGILPTLIMLICTLLIRYNLKVKRDRLFHLVSHLQQHRGQHLSRSRDQQALAMLFIQMLVYILTNIPWIVRAVYASVTINMNKSADHLAIDAFLKSLTESIMYIYPTLSFPMYTLASRTFRREYIKMLRSIWLWRHQHLLVTSRIQPTI